MQRRHQIGGNNILGSFCLKQAFLHKITLRRSEPGLKHNHCDGAAGGEAQNSKFKYAIGVQVIFSAF
jgi:hypothetical protein